MEDEEWNGNIYSRKVMSRDIKIPLVDGLYKR